MSALNVCRELAELLPGYALDALEPLEHELVGAHLARCSDCVSTWRELQEISTQLALSVPLHQPPPALAGRILAQARRDLEPTIQARPAARIRAASWVQRWAGGLSIGALAVASAGLIWGASLQRQLSQSRVQLAETVAELQESRASSLSVAQVLASPLVEVRNLQGGDGAPGAQGKLWLDPLSGQAMLMASNLPSPPGGAVYQVWLVNASGRVCPGFLRENEAGIYYLVLNAPGRVSDYQRIGVTQEPAGGSPGPTGPRVIGGAIGLQ